MNWKLCLTFYLLCPFLLHGCGYGNYEECALGEMKGQQTSMQRTAEKLCERKFPFEKEIYSSLDGEFDITWIKSLSKSIIIKVKSNETEYRFTRAKMKFSKKPCNKSEYNDFSTDLLFEFESSDTGTAYSPQAGKLQCMKRDSIFGIIQ